MSKDAVPPMTYILFVIVKDTLCYMPLTTEGLLCRRTTAWTSENFLRGISYKVILRGSIMIWSVCHETSKLPRALNTSNKYRCNTYKQS